MDRRNFLHITAGAGAASLALSFQQAIGQTAGNIGTSVTSAGRLPVPAQGRIPVAVVLSDNAVMIDFAGPWEVLQDVRPSGPGVSPFELFTVAETLKPIRASAGMRIIPDYTFENAPSPKVILIPAQSGNDAMLEWIRQKSKTADVTASVCTGAFLLAKTGLLSGKSVATHHAAYQQLAMQYSDVRVVRGARFVDLGNLASSGGLSSGIDLALHLVERYFGHEIAQRTADQMEYQGQGWMNPDSNQQYLKSAAANESKPACPICGMDVDVSNSPKTQFRGKTYYFCTAAHKAEFDAAPENWTNSAK